MFFKVNYNRKNFYVDEDEELIRNEKGVLLDAKKVKEEGFTDLKSFRDFLIKLNLTREKSDTYKLAEFQQLLAENLIYSSKELSLQLNSSSFNSVLKGVNYAVIKKRDLTATLDILNKIVTNNPELTFKKISYQTTKAFDKKKVPPALKKYFSQPYFNVQKNNVEILPLLFDIFLKHIGY